MSAESPPPAPRPPRYAPPEAPPPGEPLPIAVLVSGGGTTLQNLLNEQERGRLPVEIRLVVASRAAAYGVTRARNAGVAVEVLERRAFPDVEAYSDAVLAACEQSGARLICMAGFLVVLRIPERWLGRVLNIHPALLPAFGGAGMYGDRVHEAVLTYGCKVTGCTVHIADNTCDQGPVIIQRVAPVLQGDTVEALRARVFHQECLAYPQAIRLLAEGRLRFEGRRTVIGPPR